MLKEVKVLYLNDTRIPQMLFMHSRNMLIKTLAPAEAITVSVSICDDQAIFVKVWPDAVLIGRTDAH